MKVTKEQIKDLLESSPTEPEAISELCADLKKKLADQLDFVNSVEAEKARAEESLAESNTQIEELTTGLTNIKAEVEDLKTSMETAKEEHEAALKEAEDAYALLKTEKEALYEEYRVNLLEQVVRNRLSLTGKLSDESAYSELKESLNGNDIDVLKAKLDEQIALAPSMVNVSFEKGKVSANAGESEETIPSPPQVETDPKDNKEQDEKNGSIYSLSRLKLPTKPKGSVVSAQSGK